MSARPSPPLRAHTPRTRLELVLRTGHAERKRLSASPGRSTGTPFASWRAALERLREEHDKRSDNEDDTCPVCLEDLDNSQPVELLDECKHGFHRDCIQRWSQQNANCVMCKKESTPMLAHGY